MLPLIRREFVEKRDWMTDDEMVDTIAAVQSLPGIIAGNMGVMVGYRVAGVPGSIAALIGGALPPFLVIVALAALVSQLRQYAIMGNIFLGVRAAISALILMSVISLFKKLLGNDKGDKGSKSGSGGDKTLRVVIAVSSFVALAFMGVDVIWPIVAGAVAGLLLFRIPSPKEEK